MSEVPLDELLGEQMAYYRARAAEYDQWFLRQGRYDRGAELNARWFAEAHHWTPSHPYSLYGHGNMAVDYPS